MLRTRPTLAVLATAAATGLAAAAGFLTAAPATAAAPHADYIVVLHDSVQRPGAVAAEHRRAHRAQVSFTYGSALKGYAARLSGSGYAEVVRDRRVAYVVRDGEVHASDVQTDPPWGLDRVDQRALPLSGTYASAATGSGVVAYVVDTGIRYSHEEFGGRASFGYDAFGGTGSDCNGHGTHVAGTVGGARYGVAKQVSLVSVRVLDCGGSGTWSGVIAGLDWAAGHHQAGAPAVANLSLGGGANTAVDDAVRRLIGDGVTVAVAAGNGNAGGKAQDACNYSPARVSEAITIGATTQSDAKTSWSNYGSCVDWFAPGYQITSAWYQSDTQSNTISGTSMATPHTAGAAALYLEGAPSAGPATVRDTLYDRTTKDVVTSSKTPDNHLLYTGTDTMAVPDGDGDGGTKPRGNSGK